VIAKQSREGWFQSRNAAGFRFGTTPALRATWISDRFFQSDSPLAASSEWHPLTGCNNCAECLIVMTCEPARIPSIYIYTDRVHRVFAVDRIRVQCRSRRQKGPVHY
jgi:hypothetical protein